jgi:Mobilization protein NikA
MARRSGSEKRQRNRIFTVRLTPQEAATIRQKAAAHGQTVGALVRSSLLHIRLQPSRIELQAVARLLGQLGRIGSNINQIAYHLNAGRPGDRVTSALEESLRDLAELRIVCLQALGKEPRRGATNDED